MAEYEIDLDGKFVVIGLILIFVLIVLWIHVSGNMTGFSISDSPIEEEENNISHNMRIAACPTFYYMLSILEDEKFEVYPTESTGQSIYGISTGQADAFISGRALRPDEPNLNREILGPGFSFISEDGKVVFLEDLDKHQFYTDEDKEDVINTFDNITDDNLESTEDVYEYLENGIGITSLENTDYSRSEVVNILDGNGFRHRYSRTPSLYYTDEIEDEKIEYIVGFLEE